MSIDVRRIALVATMVLALALIGGRAWAASAIFAVRDVGVDVTAANADLARTTAIAEAQRQALDTLLQRMTDPGVRSSLPHPSPRDIAGLVVGFQVNEEKVAPTRYLGRFTVTFRAAGIRRLLRDAKIAYADQSARPTLVVPLLINDGSVILWSDNGWRDAWLKTPPGMALMPWVLPTGDAADQAVLSPDQARAGDAAALATLQSRYPESVAATIAQITVDSRLNQFAYQALQAGETVIAGSIQLTAGDPPRAGLARALAAISAALDTRYARDNGIAYSTTGTLEASAQIQGLDDWLSLQRKLAQIPRVEKVAVRTLSRRAALIDLTFAGDAATLASVLRNQGVVLEQDASGGWQVRSAEAGQVQGLPAQ